MNRFSFRSGVRPAVVVMLAALAVVAIAACNGPQGSGSNPNLKHLTLGLTYVPNIQFAPFYVAEELGYYRDAGLDVTLHHHTLAQDEFGALVAHQEDVIIAGGDETLQAQSRGIPLVYIAQMYNQYPVTLIVPASSPIHSAADLRGHSIGIPGAYGANYIGLLALLQSAGLSKSDVNIQSIGYTQVPALMAHRVDAVVGYINNEPIQFQKAGFAIRTIPVAASTQPLISDGLAALDSEIGAHPDEMKAVVKATLRGEAYTLAHPQQALNLSKKYVPDLSNSTNAANALVVLQATNQIFKPTGKPGYTDSAAWQSMESFLYANGQLAKQVDASKAYSNAYLPS